MKRKILLALIAILTLALCFSLTSCGDDETVASIEYVKDSISTEYTVGEAPDFSGLKVKVTYEDGSTETVGADKLEIGTVDTSSAGKKALTVKYGDFSIEITVTVKAAPVNVTGIEIVESSAETSVKLGAVYNTSALQVEAIYSDGTRKPLANDQLQITLPDTSSTGEKSLTVKYLTFEDVLTVTVTGVSEMKVIANSIDSEIYVGTALDTSRLTVLVTYSNGETKTVQAVDLTIGSFDSSSIGEKKLTIVYDGFTYQYAINVYGPISLSLNKGSFDTEILVNGTPDFSGITGVVSYSNGTTKTVSYSDLKLTNISTAKAGKQTLTVSYAEVSAEPVEITVVGVADITVIGVKNEILVGEALDTSDMKLSVTYTNGKTAVIENGFTADSIDSTSKGEKKLTVAYLDATEEYTVKVYGISHLSISGVPSKVEVNADTFDLSGLVATLVYSNGATVIPQNNKLHIESINLNIPGKQTLTVTYEDSYEGEFSASVDVTVIGVREISITGGYSAYVKAGDTIETENVKIKVVYTDGTSKTDITPTEISANSVTGVITASYTERGITKTATASVTVCSPVGIKVTGIPRSYKADSDVTLSDVAPEMKVFLYYISESKLEDDEVTDGFSTNFDSVKELFKEENRDIELTVSYSGFSTVVPVSTTEPELESIIIDKCDTVIAINKAYDKSGIKVIAIYSNSRKDELLLSDLTISDIDVSTAGEQTLTVTYNGKTATETVKVLPVDSISVSGLDSKINIGSELTLVNLTVTVTYSDGVNTITEEVEYTAASGITIEGFDKTVAGDQTLKVKYLGKEATHTVHVKAIKEITVTGSCPEYIKAGGVIDTAGVTVKVVYTDGDFRENVAPTTVNADNATGIITATYTEDGVEKTATETVKVLPVASISVSGLDDKVNIGSELILDNLIVTVTYSDGTDTIAEAVKYADATGLVIEGFDKTVAGDQTLKVKYLGKEAAHTVHVKGITKIELIKSTYKDHVREGYGLDTSNLEIRITYSDDTTVTGKYEALGALLENTKDSSTGAVTLKVTLTDNGQTFTDTDSITNVVKVYSVDALNGTVPSVMFSDEQLPLDKIALTVNYEVIEIVDGEEVSRIVPYLVYLTDPLLTISGSGSDYNAENGTWASSGEKMLTLIFDKDTIATDDEGQPITDALGQPVPKWSAVARITLRGVASVELVEGSMITTVLVGEKVDIENAQFKITYTDGSYTYVDTTDNNLKFNYEGFSTASEGTTSFNVTYRNDAEHYETVTVTVTKVEDGNSGIVFGVEKPKSITARDTYKTNFTNQNNVYVVGDDNPFIFRLVILKLDDNRVPTSTTSYEGVSNVYLLDENDLSAEGTLVTNNTTYVDVIDEINNTFDFAEGAVGKYFRIVSAPKSAQTRTQSIVVKVENAYNVYDEKELNLITNYDEDLDGSNLQLYKDENGNEYGQLTAVKKFLTANNIEYKNISGIVLHGNMNITEDDLPPEYFYTYEKDGVTKKGLLDYFAIYNRNLTTASPSFTIYGNYYSIYSYSLPCVVESGFANNDNSFSDSELILMRGRDDNAIKGNTTLKHTQFKASVVDTGFRDNDPNSNDQSASARHMLGLVGLKFRKCEGSVINTNVEAFYISLFADWDNLDLNITDSNIYNAWQGHLFIFNENDLAENDDELPGEYYQNIRIKITNSLMGKCGGPVILSQQRDGGMNKNLYSGADVVVDDKSNLYSYVTGQEAWFVAMNASAQAANIMLLNNPIAGMSGNTASITSTEKIQGVSTMNLIMLTMNSGFTTDGVYTTLNDSMSIAGNNVLELGADGLTNNYELDQIHNSLTPEIALQYPIFQTSAILPIPEIAGLGDINPTFIVNPNPDTSKGETYINDPIGPALEKSLAQLGYDHDENSWMSGEYVTLYYGGLGVVLEYYHPTN